MRVCALVACGFLIAACDSAVAADCGKGMMWPYVRQPGDCLTDVEIRAGQTGVYSGPVNTNPDLSAIKPEEVPPAEAADCPLGLWWPFVINHCASTTVLSESLPADTASTAAIPGAAAPAAEAPAPVAAPAPVTTASGGTANVSCRKGLLWPFVRDEGDCPTAIERQEAKAKGTTTASNERRNQPVVAAPAPATGNPPVAATPATVTNRNQIPQATPAAETCHKGLLWPFKREPGDCPTTEEKRRQQQSR